MKIVQLRDPNNALISVNSELVAAVTDAIDGSTQMPAVGIQVLVFSGGAQCVVKGTREGVIAKLTGAPVPGEHTKPLFGLN